MEKQWGLKWLKVLFVLWLSGQHPDSSVSVVSDSDHWLLHSKELDQINVLNKSCSTVSFFPQREWFVLKFAQITNLYEYAELICPGFSLELHCIEDIVLLKTACALDYPEKCGHFVYKQMLLLNVLKFWVPVISIVFGVKANKPKTICMVGSHEEVNGKHVVIWVTQSSKDQTNFINIAQCHKSQICLKGLHNLHSTGNPLCLDP